MGFSENHIPEYDSRNILSGLSEKSFLGEGDPYHPDESDIISLESRRGAGLQELQSALATTASLLTELSIPMNRDERTVIDSLNERIDRYTEKQFDTEYQQKAKQEVYEIVEQLGLEDGGPAVSVLTSSHSSAAWSQGYPKDFDEISSMSLRKQDGVYSLIRTKWESEMWRAVTRIKSHTQIAYFDTEGTVQLPYGNSHNVTEETAGPVSALVTPRTRLKPLLWSTLKLELMRTVENARVQALKNRIEAALPLTALVLHKSEMGLSDKYFGKGAYYYSGADGEHMTATLFENYSNRHFSHVEIAHSSKFEDRTYVIFDELSLRGSYERAEEFVSALEAAIPQE
jgi:hypothetical protein